MKKLVLICGLFLSMAVASRAQNNVNRQMPDPKEMSKRVAADLQSKLKLTVAQTDKLAAVLLSSNEQMVKMLKENPKREIQAAKFEQFLTERDVKIKSVLTPSQQKAFLALQKRGPSKASRN